MRIPPSSSRHRGRLRALAWLDVLAVVVLIVVLVVVILPSLARPRHRHGHQRIKCVNNLKNLGLGFRIFATDNDGSFPWDVAVEKGGSREEVPDENRIWRHFQVISNELSTPRLLQCPGDARLVARDVWSPPPQVPGKPPLAAFGHNDHVSYFLAVGTTEEEPDRVLGGDRNLMRNGVPVQGRIQPAVSDVMSFTSPGHHEGAGNLLLSDGSVRQVPKGPFRAENAAAFGPHGTNPPPILLIP